jgi:hypothetical protein
MFRPAASEFCDFALNHGTQNAGSWTKSRNQFREEEPVIAIIIISPFACRVKMSGLTY